LGSGNVTVSRPSSSCDGVLRVVAIGKRNDDEVYRRLRRG